MIEQCTAMYIAYKLCGAIVNSPSHLEISFFDAETVVSSQPSLGTLVIWVCQVNEQSYSSRKMTRCLEHLDTGVLQFQAQAKLPIASISIQLINETIR